MVRTGNADVVIDLTPIDTLHGQRGIGRYVAGLVAALTAGTDREPRVAALAGRSATGDGFPGPVQVVPGLALRPADLGWLSGRIGSEVALRQQGARAFHATDPQRPWRPGCPTTVTVYDLIPLHLPQVLASWRPRHRAIYRWYVREIPRADRILAISRATADDVARTFGMPPDRVDVVYPVVQAPEARQPRLVAGGPIRFLWLGVPDPHKRPELAIAALAIAVRRGLPATLSFVGPATPTAQRDLLAAASRAGVADVITVMGRVSQDRLEAVFAEAGALLVTSEMEGFGLPGVEAALRGVPVIAVDTPVAREALDAAATFVGADAEAIADAMESPVAPTPEALTGLRDRYGPERVGASLRAAYRRLLEGQP